MEHAVQTAALAAIKADGTLDGLIARWFPHMGKGPFFPD